MARLFSNLVTSIGRDFAFTPGISGEVILPTTYYTVSFLSEGGSYVAPQTYAAGSLFVPPTPPTRQGYTFTQWWLASSGAPTYINSNLTLQAGWELEVPTDTFTITFNSNGGSSVSSLQYQTTDVIYAPTTPTRTGYKFVAWLLPSGNPMTFGVDGYIGNFTATAAWQARLPGVSGTISKMTSGTQTYDATSIQAVTAITQFEGISNQLPHTGFLKYNIKRHAILGGNKEVLVPFYKNAFGDLCQSAFYMDVSKSLKSGASSNIFNWNNDDHDSQALLANGNGVISKGNNWGSWGDSFLTFNGNTELSTNSTYQDVFGTEAYNVMANSMGHYLSFPMTGAEVWFDTGANTYFMPNVNMSATVTLPSAISDIFNGNPTNHLWSISDGVNCALLGSWYGTKAAYVSFDLTTGLLYDYEIIDYDAMQYPSNQTEEDTEGSQLFAINAKNSFHENGSFYMNSLEGTFYMSDPYNDADAGWRFKRGNIFNTANMMSTTLGNSTQSDRDVFGSIDPTTKQVWFADWGHDDGGIFGKGNDNTLGIQKTKIRMLNTSDIDGIDSTPPPPGPPLSGPVIFNQSNGGANNTVTGGWDLLLLDGGTPPVSTVDADGISLNTMWWCQGAVDTKNTVNITGAKSIDIVVSSTSNSPWYGGSSFQWPNDQDGFSSVQLSTSGDYNFSNRSINIPITDGGIGKFRLYGYNSGSDRSSYIKLHSIVVNY